MSDNIKSSLNDDYIELLGNANVSETPKEETAEIAENCEDTSEETAETVTEKSEEESAGDLYKEKTEETDEKEEKPEKSADKKPGEYTDISSSSEKPKNPFKRLSVRFNTLPKKKKIIISLVVIFLSLIIIQIIAGGIFISQKFKIMGQKINEGVDGDIIYEEQDFEEIDGDAGAYGFMDALREWSLAGSDSIMSSKNVINVLLIGADSRKGTNTGNTDVMMLVSINKKTKQIKLVSFFRDSYLYIEDANGGGHYGKLNSAFSTGEAEGLMNTIEKNYKINIDNFIMVNFESFKDLIDAMDGVTVDVQKYEADYMKKRFKLDDVPYGEDVTLNGLQALCFCRSRNCDSDGDVSRTRRQRQVINAIIDEVENASLSELNKYIDTLLPYLYTGYSKSEILTLGVKAYAGKWMNFERSQLQMPPEEARISGYAGSAWIWVVDYQLSAQMLQNEIYGKSNIMLDESRRTLIDIYHGVNGSGSYSSGYSNSGSSGSSSSKTEKPEKTTAPETTVENTTQPAEITQGIITTEPQEIPGVSESTPQETEIPTETQQSDEPVSEEPNITEPVSELITEAPPTQPEESAVTEIPDVSQTEAA